MIALIVAVSLIKDSLLNFAVRQWKATPEMRIEDAYKWLFHATLGGEHAVADDDGPRQWLDREWAGLGRPKPGEPEVVPLGPDGRLVRINLRPYRARGGDKEMLLAVFVDSAREFHADRRVFIRKWQTLGQRLRYYPVGHLRYAEWQRLDKLAKADRYPAIDHSAVYERTYRPAYRVVLGSKWTSRR